MLNVPDVVIQELETRGYDLLEEVGRGGFAKVYTVKSKKYDQVFCCKIVSVPDGADRRAYHMTYIAELEALKSLMHPNIITIFDYFEISESYFAMILEYCAKGSIIDILRRTKQPLKKQDLYNYFRQLVSALNYMHSKGMTHHDIKPANLLIDSHNRLKLADFGLAAKYHPDGSNMRKGSMLYCAPEIFGLKPYDSFKTDAYSLGVTIYQIATGHLPFNGRDIKEIRTQQIAEVIKQSKYLPSEMYSIIKGCLRFNPEERISIAEIWEKIKNDPVFAPQSSSLSTIPNFLSLSRVPGFPSSLDRQYMSGNLRRLNRTHRTINVAATFPTSINDEIIHN